MSFGRITKLNVHIGKCQTHITYANDTTRLLTNNPSGFAFRSMGTPSFHCRGDALTQARSFLHRHFGKRGSIEKTSSLDNFLHALGVDFSLDDEAEELQEQAERLKEQQQLENHQEDLQQEQQEVAQEEFQEDTQEVTQKDEKLLLEDMKPNSEQELHTWHLELLPKLLPQLATKIEWHEEQLQVSNCAWHLQNCNWRNIPNSEFQLPNCQCDRIKEMMEHINKLVTASMPTLGEEEDNEIQLQDQSKPTHLMSDVNANIMSLNGLLQQLNQLLEQQNEEQAGVSSSILID